MSEAGALTLLLNLMLALALAAGLVWRAIPALMPLFRKYALARPNARSSHREPTPQGGGAPVVLAVLIVAGLAAVSGLFGAREASAGYYLLVLAAAFALALLGGLDDIQPLPALFRLVIQLGLVGVVMFGLPEHWRLLSAVPAFAERAVLALAAVWFVNLTNFMDGIDWMVVVEAVPMLVVLALLAALGITSAGGGVIAAALAGALIGFAPFNRHPARLFLGDVGSLPIGLMIAALLTELATTASLAAALLLPLYFLFDATETLVRGVLAGHDVTKAHRRHAYQNAVDGGWTAPQVTATVVLLNLGLAVLALAAVVTENTLIEAGLLLIGLVATAWVCHRLRRGQPGGGP